MTELRRKLQEEHGSCIKEREKRIKEILNKEIPKAKPGNWARRRFAPASGDGTPEVLAPCR